MSSLIARIGYSDYQQYNDDAAIHSSTSLKSRQVMSKRKKRLERIRQNPKHVTKEAVEQVLTDYGFIKREGKGSHTVYQHPNEATPLVIAVHGKHVPAYIVKQVVLALDRVIEQEQVDDDESEDD
jgi:predicted RNA binding protein YcfA (HicA-like mRNA interferase family)